MTYKPIAAYNEYDGKNPAENLDSRIPQTEQKLTLTINELAYHLNVSRATAYALARRKDFYPMFHIGHRMVISLDALKRWLAEQTEGN